MGKYLFEDSKTSWLESLPASDLDVCEEHFDYFFKTMYKRQNAWYNRFCDLREKPWCDDDILNEYKFTNVYRELDRSSQYLIHTVMQKDVKYKYDLVWRMLAYRLYNQPDGFESGIIELPHWEECDDKKLEEILDKLHKQTIEYRETAGNPWHTAYYMNIGFVRKTKENTPEKGMFKDWAYVKVALKQYWKIIPYLVAVMDSADKPEDIIQVLESLPACSTFQSHEFYIDMCYIPLYTDFDFKFNQNDYTNVGPGASLGIRLILPSLKPNEQINGIYLLQSIANEHLLRYYPDFKFIKWDKQQKKYLKTEPNITLHQIEMWLCEYQKYWKVQNKIGKQRSKFSVKTINVSYRDNKLI